MWLNHKRSDTLNEEFKWIFASSGNCFLSQSTSVYLILWFSMSPQKSKQTFFFRFSYAKKTEFKSTEFDEGIKLKENLKEWNLWIDSRNGRKNDFLYYLCLHIGFKVFVLGSIAQCFYRRYLKFGCVFILVKNM